MSGFEIAGRTIGDEAPAYVIAEVGSNHNNDFDQAKELIDAAVRAGADAVKFQTFRAEDVWVEDSGQVEYLDDDRTIYQIAESTETPYEWIPKLYNYCQQQSVQFLSTPFDERSADALKKYVPAWKVASYTSSHYPFLRYLADTDKPIIMSSGAHKLTEVAESVGVLRDEGVDDLALLQCVAAYPTPIEDINVRVVETLKEEFDVPVGLSDHTTDPVTAPTAAVALGANVIEKHFTLDRTLQGPDHQFALEPDELEEMITAIRQTEAALGTGTKTVLDIETELHDRARRRVHTTAPVQVGEKFTETNTDVLRSGNQDKGLHPKFYDEILGCRAAADLAKNAGVTWDDIED